MGILFHPGFDRRGLVGAQVVENDVDVLPSRRLALDRVQKLQELLGVLTGPDRAGDFTGQDIEGCVQTRGAIAFVVWVRLPTCPGDTGSPG